MNNKDWQSQEDYHQVDTCFNCKYSCELEDIGTRIYCERHNQNVRLYMVCNSFEKK